MDGQEANRFLSAFVGQLQRVAGLMRRHGAAAPQERSGLEAIERASQDELRALQLTRLRWSLAHAYANVACYRGKCEAAGVQPTDLRSLADLRHFPFTVKDDLRANYPFGMFAVPRARIVRLHASSGTTGKPTVVGYTRKATSTPGLRSWRARSAPPAAGRAIWCTSPTATGCSPAGWARTTAPSGSAAR